MVRHQTSASDDTKPTRPPARVQYDSIGQEHLEGPSSFDGEERSKHVGGGDSGRFSTSAYSRDRCREEHLLESLWRHGLYILRISESDIILTTEARSLDTPVKANGAHR